MSLPCYLGICSTTWIPVCFLDLGSSASLMIVTPCACVLQRGNNRQFINQAWGKAPPISVPLQVWRLDIQGCDHNDWVNSSYFQSSTHGANDINNTWRVSWPPHILQHHTGVWNNQTCDQPKATAGGLLGQLPLSVSFAALGLWFSFRPHLSDHQIAVAYLRCGYSTLLSIITDSPEPANSKHQGRFDLGRGDGNSWVV